jgi:pentatricopeptide repeat protein
MKAAGVPGDSITYSVLISACEKGGQWQKAWEFMKEDSG